MIVFFFVKSRTVTEPSSTRVSVPSQRSAVSQKVPRTVAELYLPRVRKLPVPWPQRLRMTFLLFFALGALAATCRFPFVFLTAQMSSSPPSSTNSVTAVALVCWISNTPPNTKMLCALPSGAAVVIWRMPFVASIGVFSGTFWSAVSGCPFTSTVPATGCSVASPGGGGVVGGVGGPTGGVGVVSVVAVVVVSVVVVVGGGGGGGGGGSGAVATVDAVTGSATVSAEPLAPVELT